MDPVTPTSINEVAVYLPEPAYTVEIINTIEIVPLPLNPRGLTCVELGVTWAGISGVSEECENDDRPDTGMMYPRG